MHERLIFFGAFLGIMSMLGVTQLLGVSHVASPATALVQQQVVDVDEAAAPEPEEPAQCTIGVTYPEAVRQWCDLIERYARENGVDPNLVSAVMLQESAGQPDAYSKSGAVGLLQVMPRDGKASQFQCKNGPCFSDRPSMDELFDPEFNVAYGTRMLAGLIQRYGNLRDALRAYGPKDVGYYYADLVLGIMQSHQ